MNIGLFGDMINNRGPSKVFKNLIKGLKILGHDVNINEYGEYNGSLCPGDHPSNTLMGPNVMVVPTDNVNFWNRQVIYKTKSKWIYGFYENFELEREMNFWVWSGYTDYITPSKWVYDKYRSFDITKNTNIHIWSVGIDTELFKPTEDLKTLDCFIYFKNRYDINLNLIINFLNDNNLKFEMISYGSYNEYQLMDLCKKSKFCILIDNTESQGIAYMEILSMDIPIYVLDCKLWNNRFPATSVPYFDKRCGLIESTLNGTSFEIFYNNLNNYKSREYIIENHTLEISANKYVEILKNIK